MQEGNFCGEMIDGRFDDCYNSDHTKICCIYCNTWQDVEE